MTWKYYVRKQEKSLCKVNGENKKENSTPASRTCTMYVRWQKVPDNSWCRADMANSHRNRWTANGERERIEPGRASLTENIVWCYCRGELLLQMARQWLLLLTFFKLGFTNTKSWLLRIVVAISPAGAALYASLPPIKGRREHTSSWKEIQVQWSQSSRPWRGVDDISRAWAQSKTEPMGSHGTKGWLAIGQKVSTLYTYSKVIWSIFVSIWFSEGNSVIIWQDETHTVLKHITNRVRKHKLFRGVLNFPRRDVTKLYRLLLLQWVINSWCGNYVGRGRIRSNDMVKSRLIFVVLEKRERNSPFWGSILLISQ